MIIVSELLQNLNNSLRGRIIVQFGQMPDCDISSLALQLDELISISWINWIKAKGVCDFGVTVKNKKTPNKQKCP